MTRPYVQSRPARGERLRQNYHRAFVWSALFLAVLLGTYSTARIPPTLPGAFAPGAMLAAAFLVAAAELVPLTLPISGRVMPFTLAFDIALLVLFGPYTVVAGYGLALVVVGWYRGHSPFHVVERVVENGLPILLGGLILWSGFPPGTDWQWTTYLPVSLLAVVVRVASDLGLAVLHAWVERAGSAGAAWRVVFGGYAYLPLLVLAPLGLLAAYLFTEQPLLLVVLLAPLLGQFISVHRHEDMVHETQLLRERTQKLEEELEARTTELNEAISQLQKRLSQSFSLQAVGAAIVQELDLERVLSVITRQAARVAGGDGAFITLLSADGQRQFIRAASGPYLSEHVGEELPLENSLAGYVVSTGRPHIANDTLEDPRLDTGLVYQARVSALVEAPLRAKDKVLGVLGVVAHNGKRFDDEDMRLLTVLANQAAIAIENARLHERQTELAIYEERSRLARELHDSVTQSLFSIGLYLEASMQFVKTDPEQALAVLAKTQEIAQEARAEMRSLIFELRPAAIREKGLDFAFENLISLVRRRHNLDVTLTKKGEGQLPGDVEFCLYRVAQEALNNVSKHAEAKSVRVEVDLRDTLVVLLVEDDGKGFDVKKVEESGGLSFGLTSMRERVSSLGGRLEIQSRPGKGTLVRAELPLAEHRGK